MVITGCMMNFYRSAPAVIFWQWFNQSFNALVNYTNRCGPGPQLPPDQLTDSALRRSGDAAASASTLLTSYLAATGGALATALGLNSLGAHAESLIIKLPRNSVVPSPDMSHSVAGSLPPLAGRLVPFAACSAANCLNIPLMRRQELGAGTTVETSQGEALGSSRVAAREAIARVTLSRIGSGPLHYLHSIYTL